MAHRVCVCACVCVAVETESGRALNFIPSWIGMAAVQSLLFIALALSIIAFGSLRSAAHM